MSDDNVQLEIFVSVHGGDQEKMAKAMEKLTMIATGLAMEGLRTTITINTDEDEYDDAG